MVEFSEIPRAALNDLSNQIVMVELSEQEKQKENLKRNHLRKAAYVFTENIQGFIDFFGEKNCGFLTLTFADDVRDVQIASKRFNSFRTNFLSKHFLAYIGVYERTKRGVIHFHFLVACKGDIKSGFDFEQIKARNYSGNTCNAYIRSIWRLLRENLDKYGFGRHELMPIKSKVGVSKYLAKYLIKGFDCRLRDDKGFRFVRCSQDKKMQWKRCNFLFSWASQGAKNWRKGLEMFCNEFKGLIEFAFFKRTGLTVSLDSENYSDLLKIGHGGKWCFNHKHLILSYIFMADVVILSANMVSCELRRSKDGKRDYGLMTFDVYIKDKGQGRIELFSSPELAHNFDKYFKDNPLKSIACNIHLQPRFYTTFNGSFKKTNLSLELVNVEILKGA